MNPTDDLPPLPYSLIPTSDNRDLVLFDDPSNPTRGDDLMWFILSEVTPLEAEALVTQWGRADHPEMVAAVERRARLARIRRKMEGGRG